MCELIIPPMDNIGIKPDNKRIKEAVTILSQRKDAYKWNSNLTKNFLDIPIPIVVFFIIIH